MNLSTLLDRIAGKQQERQQSREADFRALVTQIADGKDPDPEFVDGVLTENKRSVDDLRKAVELLLHRRQLRQTWDKAAGGDKDRDRLQKQIVEADNLLEQAELQHEETTAPLHARIDLIKQARAEADRARQQLWESCPYPALNDELTRVAEQLQVLHRQHASAANEAADLRQWAKSDRQEIARVAHESEEVELRERADRRDAKAKSLEGEAAPLREQIKQLDQQEKQIREKILEP